MVAEIIRKIVDWKKKETLIDIFLKDYLRGKYVSKVELYPVPLGEKVVIYTARPRAVAGKANERLSEIAQVLKDKFGLSNPQIEVRSVDNPWLDAQIVAERVAMMLERLGTKAFKMIGYRTIQRVMEAGARGVEIRMTGKIPGQRSNSWKFYTGYMKKSGEVNKKGVRKAIAIAKLPAGVVGVKVSILPPDVKLPDEVRVKELHEINIEALSSVDPEISKKLEEYLKEQTSQ